MHYNGAGTQLEIHVDIGWLRVRVLIKEPNPVTAILSQCLVLAVSLSYK